MFVVSACKDKRTPTCNILSCNTHQLLPSVYKIICFLQIAELRGLALVYAGGCGEVESVEIDNF
jgi:hypothetical protein